MIALINGSRGLVSIPKGSDAALKIIVANDDGSSIDLTGDTVDLVVYDRSDRLNAAIATHSSDALTVPLAGYATLTMANTETSYGPGDFFAFVRWTDVSASKVYFSDPFALSIG